MMSLEKPYINLPVSTPIKIDLRIVCQGVGHDRPDQVINIGLASVESQEVLRKCDGLLDYMSPVVNVDKMYHLNFQVC